MLPQNVRLRFISNGQKEKKTSAKTTSNQYAHAIHASKTKYQSMYIRNKQQLLYITSQVSQAWYQAHCESTSVFFCFVPGNAIGHVWRNSFIQEKFVSLWSLCILPY